MKRTPSSPLHLTFGSVSVETLKHLPLYAKVHAAAALACVGGCLLLSIHALRVLHAPESLLDGAVSVWTALLLLGVGARFWNWFVMPQVFEYLWEKSAEKGFADRYAAKIRLEYGDSMNHIARERGFSNLVRGYCAACNSAP